MVKFGQFLAPHHPNVSKMCSCFLGSSQLFSNFKAKNSNFIFSKICKLYLENRGEKHKCEKNWHHKLSQKWVSFVVKIHDFTVIYSKNGEILVIYRITKYCKNIVRTKRGVLWKSSKSRTFFLIFFKKSNNKKIKK